MKIRIFYISEPGFGFRDRVTFSKAFADHMNTLHGCRVDPAHVTLEEAKALYRKQYEHKN